MRLAFLCYDLLLVSFAQILYDFAKFRLRWDMTSVKRKIHPKSVRWTENLPSPSRNGHTNGNSVFNVNIYMPRCRLRFVIYIYSYLCTQTHTHIYTHIGKVIICYQSVLTNIHAIPVISSYCLIRLDFTSLFTCLLHVFYMSFYMSFTAILLPMLRYQ